MNKTNIVILVIFLLIPTLLFSQAGKLRGKVTDANTGDPIADATILIKGSIRSVSTDLDGDYVLPGLPPDVYSVQAEYIGCQTLVISNVRIFANLTTTMDIQLKSATFEMETIQIIAERLLIQRSATATIRLMTQDDLKNLPIRGLQNIISLNAGTVEQDGILHIRGGRPGEVFYYIDGATATNPLYNTEIVGVIQEAIEEVQIQPSGYTADLGGGNSGAIRTTLRSGGDQFKATIDYRTDDFVKTGDQFPGTSSFGYRNGVITLSGPMPVVQNLKFFIAGQHHFMRNDNPIFIKPFKFEGLVEDFFTNWWQEGIRTEGDTLPNNGVVEFKRNHLPHNSSKNNIIQGTLVYDVSKNIKLRYSGSYSFLERQTGGDNFYQALKNYFALGRQALWEEKTNMNNLRLTHILSPKTFYELSAFYSSQQSRSYDPVFGNNWRAYTDSAANFEKGYGKVLNRNTGKYESTYRSKWRGPYDYSVIYGFDFEAEDSPVTSYHKYNFKNIGVSGSFHAQMNKNWELIAGGRYDSWLMRRLSVDRISSLMQMDQGVYGKTPNPYDKSEYRYDYERNVRLQKAGNMTLYGYDIDGNEINSGVYGANKPVFASAFIQNKFEYKDLVFNIGLRYERVDIKALKPKNQKDPEMDTYLDWLKESAVTRTKAYNYFLPRLNVSLPASKNTVIYTSYGKFIQMPQLDEIYRGYRLLSKTVSPATRTPYGYWGKYVGYTAKPEEIIQYEIGFNQSLTDNLSLTATGFYKDMHNLLRRDRIYSQGKEKGEVLFSGYLNDDFTISKGLELTFDLRRTKRLAARVHYTFSTTQGTGSTMFSNRVVTTGHPFFIDESGNYYRRGAWNPRTGSHERIYDYELRVIRYPNLAYPLNYNQTHRGTIMLDYRFPRGDGGKILEGLGCNVLLTFNSGHAYTHVTKLHKNLSWSPCSLGIAPLADERLSHPIEPINSSTTPWFFNVDFNLDKMFYFDRFTIKLYAIHKGIALQNLLKAKENIMKKFFILVFVLLICNSPLFAQKYVTVGAGVSGAFYNSDGLKQFKKTYNLMNQNYLKQYMKGISQPLGLRGEIAFRYFSDSFNFAGLAGLQYYTIKDVAEYHNTESRYFELKATSFYLEGEFGLNFDGFFVNGVVTLFHNNGVTLKSDYTFPSTTEETLKALDGTYKGETYYSADLGIAVGIVKEPIVLSLKVTYPVYTFGGSAVLRDKKSSKITMGTDIFPADYGAYLFSEPYDGIKSNIDGLKILLTVAFVLPLGD